jgi:hypothetical protein
LPKKKKKKEEEEEEAWIDWGCSSYLEHWSSKHEVLDELKIYNEDEVSMLKENMFAYYSHIHP